MAVKKEQDEGSRPYHHGNLRAALVDAGLSLLEEGGSTDISVRELARRVGVSGAATYRHFANKDALLMALAAEGYRRFTQATSEAAASGDTPLAGLIRSGRAHVDFARRSPALYRLMYGPLPATAYNEELAKADYDNYMSFHLMVAKFLGTDASDPRVLTFALQSFSLVHGVANLALNGRLALFGDVETLIDAIMVPPDLPKTMKSKAG